MFAAIHICSCPRSNAKRRVEMRRDSSGREVSSCCWLAKRRSVWKRCRKSDLKEATKRGTRSYILSRSPMLPASGQRCTISCAIPRCDWCHSQTNTQFLGSKGSPQIAGPLLETPNCWPATGKAMRGRAAESEWPYTNQRSDEPRAEVLSTESRSHCRLVPTRLIRSHLRIPRHRHPPGHDPA